MHNDEHTLNSAAFAICGHSGSGKTTLIEQLLPRLLREGISVAVLKHGSHDIDIDRPGKDSYRLFSAGATVLLHGRCETALRTRTLADEQLPHALDMLHLHHDLVLVEGHKHTPLPKVWLLGEGESAPPSDVPGIMRVLPMNSARLDCAAGLVREWVSAAWLRTPVYGCVLVGGKSSRMGRPKHLIAERGMTWLEHAVHALEEVAERVVIVGAGDVPEPLRNTLRLPDAPDAQGPMAGVLSAMRWAPRASWLVVPCDAPRLTAESLRWLLAARRHGVWAITPRLAENTPAEPLLAYYDFRAISAIEAAVARGELSMRRALPCGKTLLPIPPLGLSDEWANVNTAGELRLHRETAYERSRR